MSKTQKEYNLSGVITDPGKYAPKQDRIIKIQTVKGNEYKCIVPPEIFSNFQEDDIIECRVIKGEDNMYVLIKPPFTQFGVNQDNIERCFIRALKGTGFGATSANTLYNGLRNLAAKIDPERLAKKKKVIDEDDEDEDDEDNIVIKKQQIKEKEENNNIKEENNNIKEKEKIKGIPQSTMTEKLIPEIVGYDGVIPLLSNLASRFYKTADKKAVETIVSCGLSKKEQGEKLLSWWYKSRSLRRLHLLGLNNKEIEECRKDYDYIYQAILTNPFKLAPLPIEKCISLMSMLNKKVTDEHIKCGEILRKIYNYVYNNSYTCVLFSTIEYHFPHIHRYLEELTANYEVILDGKNLYLEYNHKVEVFVSYFIDKLIKETATVINELPKEDSKLIQTAKYSIDTITEEQKLAISGAIHNKISVITGGGGVGKTFCCKEIFNNFDLRGIKMIACAFTGKAVTRLNKSFGQRIARTIDFMIMRASDIDPFDVVLIDECSMVTTELIYRFKIAFPFDFSIILVGDCNQLPPISWGFFMKQLILSDRVPIYTLTRNQRIVKHTMTAKEEKQHDKTNKGKEPAKIEFDRTILNNCNELIDPKRDMSDPMIFKEGTGFYQLEGSIHTIETILTQLANVFKVEDVTCICPYNEYIKTINAMFQDIFLAKAKSVTDRKGRRWKLGDRIMMLKNNYHINIMNGEEGIIVELNDEGVKVQFEDGVQHQFNYVSKNNSEFKEDEDTAIWDHDELVCDMIQQSFCITVHKSQGSEYRIVVLFIPNHKSKNGGVSGFLNINLLYTAISRTKQAIWIISFPGILEQISINKMPTRVDFLAGRLIKMRDVELEKSLVGKTKIKYNNEKNEDDESENGGDDDIPFDFEDDF